MCDRCEELEEEVRQLKAELYAKDFSAPSELRLSYSQERILAVLLRYDRVVSYDSIFEATRDLPRAQAIVRGDKLVHAVVCKLRQRLAPFGLVIKTVNGIGYRLAPHTRQRLLNWNERAAA